MRIRSNLAGTKGWLFMRERSIRFRYMITDTAKKRTAILEFWKKYGTEAVREAYGGQTSHALQLEERSLKRRQTGSTQLRKPYAQDEEETHLESERTEELRRIRYERPNLGKEKLYPLIQSSAHNTESKLLAFAQWSSDCRPRRVSEWSAPHHRYRTYQALTRIKALRKPRD